MYYVIRQEPIERAVKCSRKYLCKTTNIACQFYQPGRCILFALSLTVICVWYLVDYIRKILPKS